MFGSRAGVGAFDLSYSMDQSLVKERKGTGDQTYKDGPKRPLAPFLRGDFPHLGIQLLCDGPCMRAFDITEEQDLGVVRL